MDTVKFTQTPAEHKVILRIGQRFQKLYPESVETPDDLIDLQMDIAAVHSNGCALDLDKLLTFDDFNFTHDVGGISRYIDRGTGKLTNCFLPRSAK